MHCAIEAKLYAENHGVGVRYTSRLISRIKNKEFGILVTTSYVDKQAYDEIKTDGTKIMIVIHSGFCIKLTKKYIIR